MNIFSKRGFLSYYALILVVVIGIFIAGTKTTTLLSSYNYRFSLYESQAAQGADAGLNLCLRLAPSVSGNFDVTLNSGPVGVMRVFYQNGPNISGQIAASSTAIILDQNGAAIAKKHAANQIRMPQRRFEQPWQR
ncbi:MAG: hypothetical protein HQM10_22325 [Candidatus Riflebacteria bacterium]|nr:hypothetical protein [Candidatus Riflebacteria bacterium]